MYPMARPHKNAAAMMRQAFFFFMRMIIAFYGNGGVCRWARKLADAAPVFAALYREVREQGLAKARARLDLRSRLFALLFRTTLGHGVTYDEASFKAALARSRNGRQFVDSHGHIYGMTDDEGVLHFNPAAINFNTPIHEYGHLALEAVKVANRALWERGMALVRTSAYYEEIRRRSETPGDPYSYLKGNDEGICDEALATLIGDRGERLVLERGVEAKLKAWLKEVWKAFKGALGIADLTEEQVERMTLGEFVDVINAELLRGGEFGKRRRPSGLRRWQAAKARALREANQHYADLAEKEAFERWESSGMGVVEYIRARAEEGAPGFDLDWEQAREVEHDRVRGLLENLEAVGLLHAARADGAEARRIPEEGVRRAEAVAALNVLKGGTFTNRATGISARLSSSGAGKLISNKAVSKSLANGFTARQHNALAARIDSLYESAALVEERPDRNGDVNVRSIRRFVSPVRIGQTEAGACITVKESVEHGNRIYSVEGIRIAALSPTVRRAITGHNSADSAASTAGSMPQSGGGVNGGVARFSVGKLYTGSAADYERPSLVHVGTGEGAQVYGWGLYASNVRGIAEQYAAEDLRRRKERRQIYFRVDGRRVSLDEVARAEGYNTALALDELSKGEDKAETADYFDTLARGQSNPKNAESLRKAARYLREHEIVFETKETPTANVYEQTFFTDRAPGDESRLLKWHEPVSGEQAERIVDGLKDMGSDERLLGFVNRERERDLERDGLTWRDVEGEDAAPDHYPDDVLRDYVEQYLDLSATGGDVYRQLAEVLGSPKAASEFLARAGIDGVKYPADSCGGRGVKDGDEAGWNCVSFRDDNIRVDHKWTDGVARFAVARGEDAVKELRTVETHRVAHGD